MTNQISAATARRFLAIRHLLAPPRALPATPESVMAVVDRLGSLQFDPLEVAGRNHDLILQARIAGYRRGITDELLYGRRLLFEAYNKALNLLPTRELPYYRIAWETLDTSRTQQLLAEQAPLADKLLALITAEGPKSSSDFERTEAISWWWGPTTAVRAVLEALSVSGRLSLARREGNRRYYDLTERLYPAELLETSVPPREQRLHKMLSRYRAHGLLGASGSGELWLGIGPAALRTELRTELLQRGELVEVSVEGVRGPRFIVADEMPLLAQAKRELATEAGAAGTAKADAAGTAGASSSIGASPVAVSPGCSFIPPLDPLMWDRSLLMPLYDFDYRWEVYTPAARRRWGYYVLPILFGDRLVGRIEPRIDRKGGPVRILGLRWEDGLDPLAEPGFVPAFADALAAYMHFGSAEAVIPPPGAAHRDLFREIARAVPVRRSSAVARAATRRAAATPRATTV